MLTKKMIDLFQDYRKLNPEVKISFTTFKRRRPRTILLAGSAKFVQCLCESCVNVMLLLEPVNAHLIKKN